MKKPREALTEAVLSYLQWYRFSEGQAARDPGPQGLSSEMSGMSRQGPD
jgi:hypothetical protein